MNKPSKNIKVTISISTKFYEQLQTQAEAIDLTVNTLLKQSALSAFNKAELSFITSEQKLIIKEFTLYQIKLSQSLQQISQKLEENSKVLPLEQLLNYMKQYHETVVKLVEDLKATK